MPLSIKMHGRPTCEDTALARERLNALGIPFVETNVDVDPAAAALVRRWNDGQRSTPTIVFGDDAFAIREPTIKELDTSLKRAGHDVAIAHLFAFEPPISDRSAPGFRLTALDGRTVALDDYAQRKFVIAALARLPLSAEALGGLRALDHVREAILARHTADAIAILAGPPDHARAAASHIGSHLPLAVDADGRVAAQYAALHSRLDLPAVFILDRYGAPRAAGSLTPLHVTEAVSWIEFLECECDECGAPAWSLRPEV